MITEAVLNRYMGVRTLAQRATGEEQKTAQRLQREMEVKYPELADLVSGIDSGSSGGGKKAVSAGSMLAEFLSSPIAKEVLDMGMAYLKDAMAAQKADDQLAAAVEQYFEIEGGDVHEDEDDKDSDIEEHYVVVRWTPKDLRGLRRKFDTEDKLRALCVAASYDIAEALYAELSDEDTEDESSD